MKFVHAADIHLDSPMRGLRNYPGAPLDAIADLTRQAFESLIELCLDEKVDFLLIAGDLYDSDWKDIKTGLYMRAQLHRLIEAGIEVVVIHGNHDADTVITRKLKLPGVHVLPSAAPDSIVLEDLGAVVHGQSFAKRAVTENLAAGYPAPGDGYYNIGILHTAIAGGYAGHDDYAPCQLEQLINHGYQYWALGHIHEPRILHVDPHVVFAGVLQGRHIREAGPKGATLVEVLDGQTVVEQRPLDLLRWARVVLDATDIADESDLLDAARQALESESDTGEGRLIAARLEIQGATPVHSLAIRERERIDAELRALASEVGSERVWLERIVWSTESPQAQAISDDALGGVLRILRSTADDPAALASLAESLKPLAVKLPAEVRLGTEGIDPADSQTLLRVLAEVERELPSLLTEGNAA